MASSTKGFDTSVKPKIESISSEKQVHADGFLLNFWKRLSIASKAAFFSCFIFGYLIHLYAFSNVIPNSDGLSRVFDLQQMTISGRWFLHYASIFNSWLQAPALIGFFSVLFMSISAGLIAHLFKIKNPIIAGFIGFLLIAFPSVAYTYLYMFTASAYFFGVLLAVLSVWITHQYKWGILPGILLLACSIGTYQSYFGVAITLSVVLVLLMALKPSTKAVETIWFGIRFLILLGMGMAFYFLILKIFLDVKQLQLLDYLGMRDTVSNYPLGDLPQIIQKTYSEFIDYFITPNKVNPYTTEYTALLNAGIISAGFLTIFILYIKGKIFKSPIKTGIVIILLAAIPLCLNITQLMNPMGTLTPIMRYTFVLVYIFILILIDQEILQPVKNIRWLQNVVLILLIATGINHFQIANVIYLASEQAHRTTQSMMTRLVDRVESLSGYQNGMQVVIIGSVPTNIYYTDIAAYKTVAHYSLPPSSVITKTKHMYYYLNDWLNVPWVEPDEQTLISVSSSELFKSMPLYPNDGSIQIVDNRVLVKLESEYKPKQQYEIDYENRR